MSVINRDGAIMGWAMRLRQVGRMQIGRLFGSVPNTDGRYKAMIDLLERSYFLRAELNAMLAILLEKNIVTVPEWQKYIERELRAYFDDVAKEWPEILFDDTGFVIKDPKALAERARRERWPP